MTRIKNLEGLKKACRSTFHAAYHLVKLEKSKTPADGMAVERRDLVDELKLLNVAMNNVVADFEKFQKAFKETQSDTKKKP